MQNVLADGDARTTAMVIRTEVEHTDTTVATVPVRVRWPELCECFNNCLPSCEFVYFVCIAGIICAYRCCLGLCC